MHTVPFKALHAEETEAVVLEQTRISETRFLLKLFANISSPLPGQFIMLGLPRETAPFLRRPFSVLDFDARSKRLEIYYSVSGRGTRILSNVRQGERLGMLGPLGRPFPRRTAGIEIMVGGGRGAAPLIFLASRRSRSRQMIFFMGAAREEEIVFLDRIKAQKIFVSTEDGSFGKRGTVIDLLRSATSSRGIDWQHATLYGCGPARMLRSLHEFSLERRVPCFVSLEARMGCGIGVCQGCAVRTADSHYSLTCIDGPIFSSSSVDWESYLATSYSVDLK